MAGRPVSECNGVMAYTVDFCTPATYTAAVTRFHVDLDDMELMGGKVSDAFAAVTAALSRAGATAKAPAIASYTKSGAGFDVAAGFPFDGDFEPAEPVALLEVGGCLVAHIRHVGPYDRPAAAYEALREGARGQGRPLDDGSPPWEEYWTGPETPPEQTRTDIYWPVATG